jgi:hypothetical protein
VLPNYRPACYVPPMPTMSPRTRWLVDLVQATLRSFTPQEYADFIAELTVPGPVAEPLVLKTRIENALAATGDNVTQSAKLLSIGLRTLRTRMRELDMPPRKAGRKFKIPHIPHRPDSP